MERRSFLGRFGMGAAAVASAAVPSTLSAQGAQAAADRNSVKAADFGAVGNGSTDDSAALQRAIDAAHALGGGTVYLEGSRGRDFRCAKPLSLDDRKGVRIAGNSGPNAAGGQAAAQFVFTGKAGPFISLQSCFSISFDGITIGYNDPAFRGPLVATGHSPKGQSDPAYLLFDRCRFTGLGRANSAESLVDLGFCLCSTIRNCEFQGADSGVVGVRAPGRYSNVIQITDCTFRDIGKVPIRSAGESWLISGCAFESLSDGRAAAYQQGAGTSSWGLVILGCWMGDVLKPGGCWIDMSQAPAYGLSIMGNRIAAPGNGPNDTVVRLGSGNQGVSISGNRMEGAIGIDFTAGYTFGASIIGNDLQCKTPIAHLENAMSHIVAGHYTTPTVIGGPATFQTATFSGDGVRGSINLSPQTFVPTTPKDGDVWVTKNEMFVRLNGVVRKVNLTQ